ncbi:hypothetical protein NONO_c73720 [Nocardia nova SH22a]|uniref:DUF4352 domain-containing protein n=1 Tax=Nocardia nova SH22a TaxID=1415166 RepID=W5TT77_9NOCA|nr:hypothetical protein [Nocardia nova]AHH22128.1 hypothetical protein NONO_c73720 [Nocardia nova SH22a]
MIRRGLAAVAALTIFVGLGATACSNDDSGTAPPAQVQAPRDTTTIDAEHHPTAHIGSTIGVQTDDPTNYGSGTQEYTILRPNGNLSVDVQVSQVAGSVGLGNFSALTDAGTRLDNDPAATTVKVSGQLVTGEVRRGSVVFAVPAGEHVTKIFVDQAYTVIAEWDL